MSDQNTGRRRNADQGGARQNSADQGGGRHSRRTFLRAVGVGTGAAAVAGAAGVGLAASASGDQSGAAARQAAGSVPFYGPHQASIVLPRATQTVLVSYDVTAQGAGELTDLFRTLTQRAAFLTAGGVPAPVGISAPPPDSGTLGTVVPADGLTITVSVGASLFDERYGLARRRPAHLTAMPVFPDDHPDPTQLHGDLAIQIGANNQDTVLHALRDIARHTRGALRIRWKIDGFVSPPRPSGTPRNHFGFKDGIANPDPSDPSVANRLVWASGGGVEPSWVTGGSYLVVRLIRMLTEFWDRVSIDEQERMIGRRRDTGAPMDANGEFTPPNYTADPQGATIPLNAHMRLANPRTAQSAGSQILRRGFNYDRGVDDVGQLDVGLIFTCYQRDPHAQFEQVQRRLAGEPMTDYVQPFGGGYFFTLPGVRDAADFYARGLLT
jgi:deferrochelatase/peroxidase EfeB